MARQPTQHRAERRSAGARKIVRPSIIPAAAVIVRRPRDRPARRGAQPRLLWALARRYAWWLSPREALARPHFIATQVMEMGDYEDVLRLEAGLGRRALVRALREAEAGRLSERSWIYWHHRLGVAGRRIPPLPRRRVH